MPRTTCRMMLGLLMLLLAACSTTSRKFSISEEELQKHITRELSLPLTVLRIFDVHLGNPVIRLDQASGRMLAKIDTKISSPLSSQTLDGTMHLSGRLGFDADSNTLMLHESRIENLDIRGLTADDRYNELFNLLAAKLGSELLSNIPLYTFSPDELKRGNRHYIPDDFRIVGRELRITLQPQ